MIVAIYVLIYYTYCAQKCYFYDIVEFALRAKGRPDNKKRPF